MKTIDEILETFLKTIKEYIKENNLNISQFAEFVQIPRRTVNGWLKNGRVPKIDNIYQVAECMGCSIDFLLGRVDF